MGLVSLCFNHLQAASIVEVWPHWLDVEGFFVACFYKAALLLQDSESRRREGLARRLLMWIRLHRWIV